jgi:transcriptional regulator with XRE-family HTH domain
VKDDGRLIPGIAMTKRELEAASMRRLRVMRGWSMQEVAKRAGFDVSQISRAENGLRKPLTMYQQAGIFQVPVDEVLIPCPHCGYAPPPGFMCLTCHQGSKAE